MTRTCQRLSGLAVLVAAAAIGLAACGGPSGTPQVASLGNGSSKGSGGSSDPQAGNPTKLLDEWTVCIRTHGDPSQVDPTIDSNKDIQITMISVPQALADEVHGGTGPCSNYLNAASLALSGGQPQPTDNPSQDLKYAQCMRANGVPKFPDPDASGRTYVGNLDPNSPTFQNADRLCTEKVGQKYYPPGTEAPGVIVVTSCTAPPGMKCPSGGPGAGNGGGGPRPVPSGNGGSGNG